MCSVRPDRGRVDDSLLVLPLKDCCSAAGCSWRARYTAIVEKSTSHFSGVTQLRAFIIYDSDFTEGASPASQQSRPLPRCPAARALLDMMQRGACDKCCRGAPRAASWAQIAVSATSQ
eukprot:5095789-Pyramimonas_sp.AAC.1